MAFFHCDNEGKGFCLFHLAIPPLSAEISPPTQSGHRCSEKMSGCCLHSGFFLVCMEGGNFSYIHQLYETLSAVGALRGY